MNDLRPSPVYGVSPVWVNTPDTATAPSSTVAAGGLDATGKLPACRRAVQSLEPAYGFLVRLRYLPFVVDIIPFGIYQPVVVVPRGTFGIVRHIILLVAKETDAVFTMTKSE